MQLLEQTSIMTNMEQMTQIAEASKRAYEAQQRVQGASMVERIAVYDLIDDEGNAKIIAGKVDAIEFLTEGRVLAYTGDKKAKMEDILGIADPTGGETDLTKAIAKALQEQNQDKKTGKVRKTGKTGGAGKTEETGKTGEAGKTGKPEESGKTDEIGKLGETGKSAAAGTSGSSTGVAGTPGAAGSVGGSGVYEAPAVTAGTTLGSTPAVTAAASVAAEASNRKPSATGADVSNTQA